MERGPFYAEAGGGAGSDSLEALRYEFALVAMQRV